MQITRENVAQVIEQVRENPQQPALKISNRPLINLCNEFVTFYQASHQPDWLLGLEVYNQRDGDTPLTRVFPFKSDYLTHVVGSIVLGFEAYLKYAITWTGYMVGLALNKKLRQLPRGKSTVDYLFNDLPGEIHPDFPLERCDAETFAFFRKFYRDVRNDLFHGGHLNDASAYDFLCVLEWYRRGYLWLTGWETLSIYVEPFGNILRVRASFPKQEQWEERCEEFRRRRLTALGP